MEDFFNRQVLPVFTQALTAQLEVEVSRSQ
jgi:hypothetical protein